MTQTVQKPRGRRIIWVNVLTVLSAATLIGAEVFGGAFAAGARWGRAGERWALDPLCCLGLEWGDPRSARPAMMNKPLR